MKELKEQWIRHITSPTSAGRFLYAQSEVTYEHAVETEKDKLEKFLHHLSTKDRDIFLLTSLFFLLQPRVPHFFKNSLHDLIRSASHISTGRTEVERNIRGKILWSSTYQRKLSLRINEASYVVRRGGKSSDVPENRLLKLFLARVLEVIDRTISLTGTGAIIKILTEIRNEAITALKHPYIKELPQTLEANYLMRKRAYRHKNHIYRELYELYVQMQQALFRSKWSNIIDLLKNGWLAPINDDDLFELYTLVVILDLIEKDLSLGEPYDYGLIRSGRREIARFKSKDEKIECDIYFDQSPTKILPFLSEYKKIVSDYNGITGIEHRPDIIMRTKNNGVERYLIIEVKKTVDERYKRDSIYKMLGYLHDFGYLWKEQQDQYPKAVLVFPTGISLRTSTPPPNRNMVIISIEDKARFLSVIKSALSC